jgi:hypothetical protein
VIHEHAPNALDFTNRRYRFKKRIDEVQRAKNRTKSKGRAKVEHVFGVIKGVFGFVKMRYRGLDKNATPVCHLRARQSVHGEIAFDETRGIVAAERRRAMQIAPKEPPVRSFRPRFPRIDQNGAQHHCLRRLIQTFPSL